MSIALLSLFIVLLVGVALSGLYGITVGSIAAGVLLLLTWPLERLSGARIRLGRFPLAVVAPLVWGVTGGLWLAQTLQKDGVNKRTTVVAPLQQDVEVDAYVNKNQIQVEKDQLIYTLTLRYRQELKLKIPKITTHPIFNGPFVMPAKTPPRIRFYKNKDGTAVRRWKITLVAVSSGPLNTPRFTIRYHKKGKPHKVIVPRIAVTVGELKQPKQLLGALKPSKGPVLPERPLDNTMWIWWAVLGGALFLGLGGVVWLSRTQGYVPPPLPPHEWFSREYNKLVLQKLLDKKEYKAHYFALSELFRGYLERRFEFPALESTAEEITHWTRNADEVSSEVTRDVRKIIQAMEGVKFAGLIPNDTESDDLNDRIHSVVRRTRAVEDVNSSQRDSESNKSEA